MLAVFVVLTALSVSWSVHQRAETARFERMQGLVYGILGATEISPDRTLKVNDLELPDPRLNRPGVGVYAEVIGSAGQRYWQSRSSTVTKPDVVTRPVGDWQYDSIATGPGESLHRLQLTTVWEFDDGEELPFIVHVVDETDGLAAQLRQFDRTLWAALLGSALALLAVQLFVLHRSLKPLRQIGEEVAAIERGEQDSLDEAVPTELAPLATGLNALLGAERERHGRYRHLIDDLAHHLKTPLTVLNNLGNGSVERIDSQSAAASSANDDHHGDTDGAIIREQTWRMQQAIERYVQRASVPTPSYLAAPVAVTPVVTRVATSLQRLYADPPRRFSIAIDADWEVRIDEADLFELIGNLLDNACKYGATDISVTGDPQGKQLIIEDNGPGFPAGSLDSLMQRGARGDSRVEGRGTGLTASRELITACGGSLEPERPASGGARVRLQFA